MKVKRSLNDLLNKVTPEMHEVRRKSLAAAINSAISGADLNVTHLGRSIVSGTTEKHQIKRADRLLSNPNLYREKDNIYGMLCAVLIANKKQPVILVDWSDLDPRKEHFLLRAAVAVEGRSLTLLDEVHPLDKKEKPAVHKAFMEKLKSFLPVSCCPIIVTDAGFRVPWFRLIESLGWDYVGRARNRTFCKCESDADWHPLKDLYTLATGTPEVLGRYELSRLKPFESHIVVYKKPKKGRKDLIATGKRARRSKKSRSSAEREKEPWLLMTSLDLTKLNAANRVVKIYRTRMQIEESFRDCKTGLNMNSSNTRQVKRLAILLLIALLAQFLLFLIGIAVKQMGLHRRLQANTVSNRNVLSYQFIALRAIQDPHIKILKGDRETALAWIQDQIEVPYDV